MPYGGTTPEQDAKIERCVSDVMPTLKQYKDAGERKSHAIAICKSRIMKKDKESVVMKKENLKLPHWTNEFTVITEGLERKEKRESIKVRGTMIKATTSRNGRVYSVDELQKARFSDNILSVNHTENVQDVVGNFSPMWVDNGWDYEAVIHNTPYHPGIVEMIEKGLVKHVSIEAIAGKAEKEGENYKVGDLEFTGLGLVKTPGIPETSLAIAEAFNKDHAHVVEIKNEEIKMTKEIKEQDEDNEQDVEEETEEKAKTHVKETAKPVKPVISEDNTKMDKLTEQVIKLTEAITKLTEIKTEKKESKGIVTETKPPSNIIKEQRKDGKVDITCRFPEY